MKRLLIIILIFWANLVFADEPYIQKVEIAPLIEEISASTVTLSADDEWVTGSTALVGRKEIVFLNTSTSGNFYISGASDSTVWPAGRYFTVYPRQNVTIKASSDLPIYVSGNSVTVEILQIK